MIIDARAEETGTVVNADVCIVGGGVAGITLAREFLGTPFEVCLLESGGSQPERRRNHSTPERTSATLLSAGHRTREVSRWFEHVVAHAPGGARSVRGCVPWTLSTSRSVTGSLTADGRSTARPRTLLLPRSGPLPDRPCDIRCRDWTIPIAGHECTSTTKSRRSCTSLPPGTLCGRVSPEVASAENVTTCVHATALEIEATSGRLREEPARRYAEGS